MIAIVAIIDLRGASMMATYGLSVIFFYSMAALLFLIPSAFVCAELSTTVQEEGGMYAWIQQAFGKNTGFFAIWLEWVNNIIGFPASLSFIAVTLTYLVNPHLAQHKLLVFGLTLSILWLMTVFTLYGIKASSRLNMVGAIMGTIIPAIIITVLALVWMMLGHKLQFDLTWKNLLPGAGASNPGFFAAIILGFGGMQLIAFHSADVINPRKDYPIAILVTVASVFLIATLSALAIAAVVPHAKLDLISGFIESFNRFYTVFGFAWATPVVVALITIGMLATFNAWFLGPARGLAVAAQKGFIPLVFAKLNRRYVPANVLLLQAILCTLFSLIFFAMPNVTAGFWVLLNLSSQSAILVYLLIFAAGIKIRFQNKAKNNAGYRIPGGKTGMVLVAGTGILTCFAALLLSVIPPTMVATGALWRYEGILLGGNLLFLSVPLLIMLSAGFFKAKARDQEF